MNLIFLRTFLILSLAGAISSGADLVFADPSDLEKIPQQPSYNVTSVSRFSIPILRKGVLGLPASLINLDEDPELEIIRSKSSYLICEEYSSEMNVTHWQLNLEPEFHSQEITQAAFAVSEALDLGTQKTMVVANGATANLDTSRFWVIDAEAGTVENHFDLPGGPDLNRDNRWDGAYSVLGAVDVPTETGLRKGLIIICNVGFDLEKRGVYAVDPWTGETLWSFQPGSALTPQQCQILDIDGNGSEEILLTSRSPHNLHGRKVNGYSDDRPYMFALKSDGNLLWSRELDSEPGFPYLKTGDLDGDGNLELVISLHRIYSNQGSVSVWSGQGELQAELARDHHFLGCQLMPADLDNHLDIITGNRVSNIMRIRYENGQLLVLNQATNTRGINILGMMNLPINQSGIAEQGLITQDQDGVGRILDGDFNIVGTYRDKEARFSRETIPGNVGSKPGFILVGSGSGSFTLEPNPLASAGFFSRYSSGNHVLLFAGIGLGLVLGWLTWRIMQSVSGKSDPTDQPIINDLLHLKERRLHLLEDLEISNHGAMAPLRSLRRLLWMLDAVHSGVGVNPNLEARMKEIWQDCHEDALPRLNNILERARLAQVANSVVDEALAAISRINLALSELDQENFTAQSVNSHLAALHKEEKATEALLQSLRLKVSDFFRTPLSTVLEKVLRANAVAIQEAGVKVQTGMVAVMEAGGCDPEIPSETPSCRMDADELGFILDNLVGNACRAMASAPRRDLRITWQPVGGMIKIDVSDTGIGIATEDHQRILEPGFSTREGGGLGLPKSQRLLKKYDGHLSIKRSKPGQGTTFSLIIPCA